jgi:hypothetical protein
MKVLVLTSEPITAQQLRDALGSDVDPADAEVMIVAPVFADSAIRFWMSDADDAIAKAEEVRRVTHDESNQRYREDLDRDELAERFGRPVDHAVL